MDEIVREFLVESYENLDQLDQDLVALELTPGSRELLGGVFRTIHTIKGTCGFLAFARLERLTHTGESLLSELRGGRRAMDQPTTDVLLRMVDTVREILASIEAGGAEGDIDVDEVIDQIRSILNKPVGETAPDGDIPEGPDIAVSVASNGDAPAAPDMGSSTNPGGEIEEVGAGRSGDDLGRSLSDSSIRVDVDVLDALMRQVGELVLARNQVSRFAGTLRDADLVRASQRLSLIATELQEGVMKARMQPIDHLWTTMPRIVRDLAASCGREVRIEVVGGDTELDRALLEAVKDPLIHLVRNAVDHGIEAVEDRLAAGKPAVGVVNLRAYHAGGQVVVEVGDDGKGIDPDRVAATAVERGLRTASQIAAMGPTDLLQLLFLPGFSMAKAVTNISGRGVGMDVVRTKIGAIGGTVEVESTVGRGTTWRLRIPLTLAIIPAFIVESAGELYAIPAVNLLEFVAPDGQKAGATIEYVGVAPVFRLRGTLLPLVELRDVLGLSEVLGSGHERAPDMPTVIAVLQSDARRFGLIVDGVLNTEEIVVKPLTARLRGVGVYAGATLLGDGRVSLILDVQAIARRSLIGTSIEGEPEQIAAPSLPVKATTQVLVVGIGGGRRVAIPLAAVTRLELVHPDVVEHVGEREVFQYRQAIVPLIRLDGAPGGQPGVDAGDGNPHELLLVVSSRGARTVAIVVTQIVDILDDDVARHSQIDDRGVVGSTVLGDRVTELLDLRQVLLSGDPSFFDEDTTAADVPMFGADPASGPDAVRAALGTVGV